VVHEDNLLRRFNALPHGRLRGVQALGRGKEMRVVGLE
jgi:hypothetical protein